MRPPSDLMRSIAIAAIVKAFNLKFD